MFSMKDLAFVLLLCLICTPEETVGCGCQQWCNNGGHKLKTCDNKHLCICGDKQGKPSYCVQKQSLNNRLASLRSLCCPLSVTPR